ncbi:MAG: hypothetical protein ABIT20_05385 [Gemmatimonadaceae bacterium]
MIAQHTPRIRAAHAHTARRYTLLATIIALVAGGAASSAAQRIPDINGPKRAAQKAADATNANISAQTGQDLPARRGAAAPASGPGSTSATPAEAPGRGASTVAPGSMAPVTREVFAYDADNRRDPFFSLILTEDLRPLLSDLKLVGILYEASGRRSVAIMRDIQTNAQYRVNTGMTLGRMRVAQIKPRAVIFTVDEFGLSRQDSLVLVDSSKVRIR